MGLADATLSTWLGLRPPGRISLGLVSAGREINGAGYRRVSGPWVMDGSEAAVRATFGPFTTAVQFDAVRLLDGDEVVRDLPIGLFRLPPGTTHEQYLSISVAEVS